jgi:hypothetical protein
MGIEKMIAMGCEEIALEAEVRNIFIVARDLPARE